jgi:hypothetical protein
LVAETPLWPGFLTWWPGGGRITFGDYERTYVANMDSGAVELLADAGPIRWSPDGRWFAYTDLLPGEVMPSPPPEGTKRPRGPAPRLGVYVVTPDQDGPPQLVAEDVSYGFAWEPAADGG